jgi:apolipoprotein N-acyltransferase
VSAGAGVVAATGQAPFDLWILSLIGLGLGLLRVSLAGTARQGFCRGWAFGLGYFALALSWIIEPFLVDLARHGWMAPFALIGMAGGMALFWGAAGGISVRLRMGLWGAAVLLAAAEFLRSYIFTGFPWALIGHIWIETPVAQWAAIIGPQGLTLLAVLFGAAFVMPRNRGWRGGAVGLSFALLWIGGTGLQGAPEVLTDRPVVRLVQPNAPQHQKWDPVHIPTFFRRQIAATEAEPRPDLIIWPETSVPVILDRAEATLSAMAEAAGGVPVVFGIQRFEGRKIYNSAALLDSTGRVGQIYDKYHLVPFGEYVPFGNVMARFGIHGMAATQGDGFSAGPGAQLMELGRLGRALPLICYEMVFPNDVASASERPDFLMQLTNDAWFGEFSGPYQHLAQARLRAIEQGVPVVRAANTGISAVIDTKGRVLAALSLGMTGHLDHPLPEPASRTIYSVTGDFFALSALITLFFTMWIYERMVCRRFVD